MRGVLFSVGPINVYAYGFMVATAVLFGIIYLSLRAKRKGLATSEEILDLTINIILGGIIGARVIFILTELPVYLRNPLSMFSLSSGGLSFYGAVLGAFILGYRYARKAKLPTWELADEIVLFVPLGYSLARVGCFLRGCCYGVPTTLPWALKCAEDDLLRHPTQIYAIIANLLIFLLLYRLRNHRNFPGFLFWLYIELYTVTRFIIEIFRDSQILAFGWLRTTQAVCFLIAGMVFFYLYRRLKSQDWETKNDHQKING